jgi:hypothetical protein
MAARLYRRLLQLAVDQPKVVMLGWHQAQRLPARHDHAAGKSAASTMRSEPLPQGLAWRTSALPTD